MGRLFEESFPETSKPPDTTRLLLTAVDMSLFAAMLGDKSFGIALGDAHRPAELVRDQFVAIDRAAHRAGGDAETRSATSAIVKNFI